MDLASIAIVLVAISFGATMIYGTFELTRE